MFAKSGDNFYNMSCQNIIPCFLTFFSSDQSLLSFKFLILYILVSLLFIVYLYKYVHTIGYLLES